MYHIAFTEHQIVCSHNTDVVRTVSTSTAGEKTSCLVTAGSSEDDAANGCLPLWQSGHSHPQEQTVTEVQSNGPD